jgi:hypothetical protein
LECLENLQFWPIPYQDIAQWELMHKDHWFDRHIPNLLFKAIKFLYNKSNLPLGS